MAEQLRRHLEGPGEVRIRIEIAAPEGLEVALLPWALERALGSCASLPAEILLPPEWASPKAPARLDRLGLVYPELLEAHSADWLPQWRPAETGFALGPEVSDTLTFFAGLVEGGIDRPLEKIDAFDRLLHGRNPAFADLERLAAAEIGVGLRTLSARLDPARPLRILADHGFRLDPRGRPGSMVVPAPWNGGVDRCFGAPA